jgi:hypothetical protein
MFQTAEEQDEYTARKRYLRRRNHHIQERDRRRFARELKEINWSYLDDDLIDNPFSTWTAELQQGQEL